MKTSPHSFAHDSTARDGDFHLAWIGAADGPCAQLLERFRVTCDAHGRRARVHFAMFDSEVLGSDALARVDRVVVACETRWSYPWQTLERLERSDLAAPWGVVTGAWHAGSRRTGIGPVTHWQLPWFRWWEGWYGWFFPELARPAARCSTQFDALTLPLDLATPAETNVASATAISTAGKVAEFGSGPQQILIMAACREIWQGWQLAAASAGWKAIAEQPRQLTRSDEASLAASPECILWDDSCLDRLPEGTSELDQACRQIEALARSYPAASIVAGLSLAHLSGWSKLQRAGASDFIIKPSFGLPLADYLVARDLAAC